MVAAAAAALWLSQARGARVPDAAAADMVLVSAGQFEMGSSAGQDDEQPVRAVMLGDFLIDRHEVSNSQYAVCVAAGVCQPPLSAASETRFEYYGDPRYDDYPVVQVTWDDAAAHCTWRGARLPTEAEWEKAARGSDGRAYPWGDDFDPAKVNHCDGDCPLPWVDEHHDDGYADTAPVDSFAQGASPYGALNMAGNVWEWVADWYAPDYYASAPSADPGGPDTGAQRVTRGGGFPNDPFYVRPAVRRGFMPDATSTSLGFRCARTVGE